MSPRVPFVVLLAAAMAGAVVASGAGDETPAIEPARAEPGVQMPAVPAADVLTSTWYCAAGTAEEGGMADHTVVVLNPGDDEVAGTVSVHAGSIAAGDDQAGDGAVDEPDAGEDGTDGDGADGDAASEDDASDDDGEAVPGQGGGEGGDPGDPEGGTPGAGGEPGVGDAWSGDEGQDAGAATAAAGREPAAREDLRVPPGGRVELRLADLHQAPLAAALVELDGPAVVEHEVAGPDGRDLAPCASTASPDWYLAWGATTRDAREVLVLFNPFPSVAAVDIEFSTDDGVREPVRYQGLPVPAGGVVGIDIGDEVTRREQVAATVRSRSGPIVVERLQSFDGSEGMQGLSLALAAPSPLESWIFAHGSLGSGRGERIVLYNPTGERAEVDVAVRPADPAGGDQEAAVPPPQPFGVTVRAGRYEVIDYAEEDRVAPDAGHATVVRSRNGVPVVAERVLTFTRSRAGSDVAAGTGAAFAATSWTFATLGGGDRPSSQLTAYNPDPARPARLSITGLVDGREVAPGELQDIEVPAGGQREIQLTEDVQGGEVALAVQAGSPVVVERLVATPGGLPQAVAPGLPGTDGAVPLSHLDLGS